MARISIENNNKCKFKKGELVTNDGNYYIIININDNNPNNIYYKAINLSDGELYVLTEYEIRPFYDKIILEN